MPAYVSTIQRPPRTMTTAEQQRLLKITGEHRAGYRDHTIISMAFGTALREFELAALNVGDVANEKGQVRRRVPLRVFKRSNMDIESQQIFIPETLAYKLAKFLVWKRSSGESLAPDAPLFISRLGKRIATRTIRLMFRTWQQRAGFDYLFKFHVCRHQSITDAHRLTKDLLVAQRLARHRSIQSTMRYAAPSDQEVADAVRDLPC